MELTNRHTDVAHEQAELVMLNNLDRANVPEHLHGGLLRYLLLGLRPGHFLTAVLENNLAEAFGRADETSRAGLFSLVTFLYNDVPRSAWGSPAKVEDWMTACAVERELNT